MSGEIILYDIASRHNESWNSNVWKARMLLNFKNLPYKTEWLEYPDIAPTLRDLGVTSHPPSFYVTHTLPTIRLGGVYTMESRSIADAVETAYPSPPLHLDSEYLPRVIEATGALIPALMSHFIARVPRETLNPPSVEYWNRTRSAFLGVSVEEFERTADKEAEWKKAEPHIESLAAMLKEHDGPFFLGTEPSYSDIVVAAFLKGTSMYADDMSKGIFARDKVFKELYDAAQPWMQRKD